MFINVYYNDHLKVSLLTNNKQTANWATSFEKFQFENIKWKTSLFAGTIQTTQQHDLPCYLTCW